MQVHNLMEDIVKNCLKDLIQHQEALRTLDERAQADIMAIALNRLPAKYVASVKGEVFAKTQLGMQAETDVYRELSYAIEKVNANRNSEL